jgi:hypothetical protein
MFFRQPPSRVLGVSRISDVGVYNRLGKKLNASFAFLIFVLSTFTYKKAPHLWSYYRWFTRNVNYCDLKMIRNIYAPWPALEEAANEITFGGEGCFIRKSGITTWRKRRPDLWPETRSSIVRHSNARRRTIDIEIWPKQKIQTISQPHQV